MNIVSAAAVAALVAWAFALAGCAPSPRGGERADSGKPHAPARPDEAAFHEMFEQTVPSIEAALPLATVADSIVRKGPEEFLARAWFSGGHPVYMKVALIESGDTTSMDLY